MNSIDNRIVNMQFNNDQFEKGIKTSVKSLDNLKKGLDLDNSVKSLSNLDKTAKSFSLANIAESVEKISSKFSTLGVIGITALQNITNSVINTGAQIIKSLTIDPIKTGLDEYETKMNAIQTILTNTSSKGTTLDDVNNALAELNTYADKTIYNFSEMTRNIGTFTAAGVDLKTSVNSIKGIANLAAGSGSSAMQASTAMYQLSQAIAAGSVKLMDWNSVVNAGMGGELFQKALEKTALELGHGRDMSVSFRESLEKGWITTEVLTKTLQKFANDDSLVKAATNVTTLTKLFDTMKESIQSGWAQTWENIIGNKSESTVLLTKVNDIFNSIVGVSAKARNEILGFWKDNGGRYAAIEALFNVFKGLSEILVPIKEAFKDIFPPMTGKRLVEITENIRDLTRNFKISGEISNNIKRTFSGLFAILDIGKQAIIAIGKGFVNILKYILPAGNGILSFTGNIGDFLVSLDKAIKTSDIFGVAIDKIGKFLKPIADTIKSAIGAIVDTFKSFGSVDLSGLDSFSDHVHKRFEPLSKMAEFLHNVFSGIANVVGKIAPIFFKLASVVGSALDSFMNAIVNAFSTGNFKPVFDLINNGLFAAILFGLKKFIDSLTGITKGAGGFLEGVTGILDGVKGSLQAYQSSLKANTLIKIAAAMAILTASIIALSMIDSRRLTSSLVAMGVMFTQLFGSMAVVEKLMKGPGFLAMGKISLMMISLSTAILILSSAMTKLSKLDWTGIKKGLTSVSALSAILIVSAKSLDKNVSGIIRSSMGLILFGAAINVLVSAVQRLSTINTTDLTKGLIGVGVLATEISLFMNTTNLSSMGFAKGLGLIGLATSMVILSEAVKKFSSIDTTALIKGLSGLAVVLSEIAVFVNFTGDAKKVISTSIGLTILGAAMLIFAEAIGKMGNMSIEQIGKGLLAMSGALTAIAVALKFIPNNAVIIGVGLIGVATSLTILSNALNNMGGMTWEQIGKSLVSMAGALTIIAVAMKFMTTALPGAAALLIISGALAILSPQLKILGSMSLSEIGKGLLALAGVFTVLGLAGLVLSPLTPIIIALGAAITLFGVGCLSVGVGVLAFSAGLTALAVSGTAGAAALVVAITSIVGLIPFIFKKVGEGIIELAKVIGENIPTLVDSIGKLLFSLLNKIIELTPKIVQAGIVLLDGFLTAIIDATPKILEAVFKMLNSFLNKIIEYIPKLVESGVKTITGFLKGIRDNIPKVTKMAIDIIGEFIISIGREIPRVISAGFKMIVEFINGLAKALRENTPIMLDAIDNLMASIIETGLQILLHSVTGFFDVGSKLMSSGFIKGIKNKIGEFVSAVGNLISSGMKLLNDKVEDFVNIGVNLVLGLVKGIKNSIKSAISMVGNLAGGVIDSFKNLLGIHSPSKVFQDYGAYIVAGLQNGIKQDTPKAVKESSTMAKQVTQASKDQFDKAVQWIEDRKYYNKLSLAQELLAWQNLQNKYKVGSEERIKADKEVYRVRQEIYKKDYDNAIKAIDDKKYYDQLSLKQELSAWKTIQSKYKLGTEEREKADKEIYRIKKELSDKDFEDFKNRLDTKKYYNQLSLSEELAAWTNVQKKYKQGSKERIEADKEVYRLKQDIVKQEYDNSVKWIDERKYYNQLSLSEELAAWERVQQRYKEGSEERKQADKEVYRVKQELIAKQKEIDQEYYDKTKEINDKLKNDIQSVNDSYEQALKSRTESLYNSYSLFDKVEKQDPVTGSDMITNLQDQVNAFEDWQKNISDLSQKGIDEGLLKELRDMGPKSLAQIKALNQMSSGELTTYVSLWRQKSNDARVQATNELVQMKIDTQVKIAELSAQAATDLETYKKIWVSKMAELSTIVVSQVSNINKNVTTTVDSMKTSINKEFVDITNDIKTTLTTPDWNGIGSNIVLGITEGIKIKSAILINEATQMALRTMQAVKNALGIHSPSKEFAKIGMYVDQGFAEGLKNFSGVIVSSVETIGNNAISTLQGIISNIVDVVNGNIDSNPIITPVVDLSNVEMSGERINKLFNSTNGINVSSVNSRIPNITQSNQNGSSININTESVPERKVQFIQNNYSPKALSRIDIYRQTKNQISVMKGLVEAYD